jgi:hypothetical protein
VDLKRLSTWASVFLVLALFVLLANPVTSRQEETWLQIKRAHYTIFYQANFEKDAEFARTWMDRTEQLMKAKYQVTPDHYQMSVYLLPAPSDGIDPNLSGRIKCCTRILMV